MSRRTVHEQRSVRPSVVLVVDDEVDILMPLVEILQTAFPAAKVYPAMSAKEALDFAADQRIDLVISDQRMPAMTGEELLGLFRARPGRPAGILMTGWCSEGLRYRASSRAISVLAKPFDAMALVMQVRAILEARCPAG